MLSEPLENIREQARDLQHAGAGIARVNTIFRQQPSVRETARALKELGLWEWVQALPRGLDTQLGPGGQGLSAGGAQLLAFTRVFLKDPGLVILDEASSRL